MMHDQIMRQIRRTKAAIMAGEAANALTSLNALPRLLERHPPAPQDRDALEAGLAELRVLAQAALDGAQSAAEQMKAIIQSARSFETYDNQGQRKITDTAAAKPRRF